MSETDAVSLHDPSATEADTRGSIVPRTGRELLPCLHFQGRLRRPRGLVECEILRAVDRPDCFRVEFLDEPPYFVDPLHDVEVDDDLPPPGTPVSLSVGESTLASGRLEEIGLHEEESGARVALFATASYDSLRGFNSAQGAAVYRDMTVSEIARRVALDLGLEARVDVNDAVVSDFDVSDDPLRALRKLSRASSMGLAVVGESLCLVRDLPVPRRTYVLDGSATRGFVRLCTRHVVGPTGSPRRLVELSLPGAATVKLLDRVRFEGYHSRRDGAYRIVRSHTRLTCAGWRSDLLLSEEGPASLCLDLPPGMEMDR